jgi:hypothetical protein
MSVVTFIGTLFLFHYGYSTQSYCYDQDKEVGKLYHSLVHVLSSIGHHCIVL